MAGRSNGEEGAFRTVLSTKEFRELSALPECSSQRSEKVLDLLEGHLALSPGLASRIKQWYEAPSGA